MGVQGWQALGLVQWYWRWHQCALGLVLEGEDVNPVLLPQVAAQPLNTKVVCHLCEDQCTDSNIIFLFTHKFRLFIIWCKCTMALNPFRPNEIRCPLLCLAWQLHYITLTNSLWDPFSWSAIGCICTMWNVSVKGPISDSPFYSLVPALVKR